MQQRTALRMAIPLSCGPLLAACGGPKDSVVPAAASVQSPAARQIYIIVQRGQTLERVAEKFHIEGRGRSPQQSESPIRAEAGRGLTNTGSALSSVFLLYAMIWHSGNDRLSAL